MWFIFHRFKFLTYFSLFYGRVCLGEVTTMIKVVKKKIWSYLLQCHNCCGNVMALSGPLWHCSAVMNVNSFSVQYWLVMVVAPWKSVMAVLQTQDFHCWIKRSMVQKCVAQIFVFCACTRLTPIFCALSCCLEFVGSGYFCLSIMLGEV